MISWRKLAIISALCISTGTVLLAIFTVTGISAKINTDNLMKYIPFVVIFALLNSLCEGIVYRSAILGSLKTYCPESADDFGSNDIWHSSLHGAPSGIVGVIMRVLLGWYLCRVCMKQRVLFHHG